MGPEVHVWNVCFVLINTPLGKNRNWVEIGFCCVAVWCLMLQIIFTDRVWTAIMKRKVLNSTGRIRFVRGCTAVHFVALE